MSITRRGFLRNTTRGVAGFTLANSLFARRLMAAAPAASNYKSLVCINLDGGNDGNNMIVPLSSSAYSKYSVARQGLAIAQNQLQPISDGSGVAYGLHPMLKNLCKRYTAGNAALVANVGSLLAPLDRTAFLASSKPVPTELENHEQQRYQWATAFCASNATSNFHSGWGGRIADSMASYSGLQFPVMSSLAGSDAFCIGDTSKPATISATSNSGFPTGQSTADLQLIANLSSGSKLVGAATSSLKDALQQSSLLSSALSSITPFKTVFPNTSLGAQLKQVACVMVARTSLAMSRQMFLCTQTGYDLHGAQFNTHAGLLSDFDTAVGAFMDCMDELGLTNQVTVFTKSDFGRSLQMNSSAGTDHAWGNHQVVLGGAVHGAHMYGTFPDLSLGGPDDLEVTGRWIPTSSIEQYGAPIASWFGVNDQALSQIFPNLSSFDPKALPFLG